MWLSMLFVLRLALRVLHGSPNRPQFRKEPQLECFREIRNAASAACAALISDDAFDGLHVTKTPKLKFMVEVDELFGELIQVPMRLNAVVHREPRGGDLLTRLIWLRPIAIEIFLRNFEATSA